MHKFKPGDWVISDNEVVINALTGEHYSWGGSIKKDTPYEVLKCFLSSTSNTPSLILKGVSDGPYHERRFKLYKRFTNTKLLSGGNV